ncbi:ShlB/FhaC/HecB family hemolysin secretion/activation protein [Xanthocytophaga agilis]|uniref:ShlB/FhaC/HecB family hemolysin secretion/activation protein n=1 Tax=Xanthocytophaga agilis TaxID=3048010 RepID=A0AAE3UI83_9BACT|nr:ShlB/FhaC/HecB family hemolysin secretion/activation protein [Xanthocytophaga agilis]MDJ1505081.1 ShlB/FhaC/HecB family hemolysin secretion/activation protein [Xanthocytophaga agilis]
MEIYLVLVGGSLYAQKRWSVNYLFSDSTFQNAIVKKLPDFIIDSISGVQIIQQNIIKLHQQGYLTASIDSISWKKDTLLIFAYLGSRFKWARLSQGNIRDEILREVDFREKIYRDKQFNYLELADLEKRILVYSEEHGYPFATISLDSIQIRDDNISAKLQYEPGVYIVFDTIRVIGSARLKKRFLENWLRIIPGQPYSQKRLDQAYNLLKQQSYLSLTQPYEVLFKNDRAYITFFADAGKSSEADGIIGFQPNEQKEGKLLLTGEVNLKLNNLLNAGGSFLFSWQQIKQGSPRLNISYTQPAFFKTPLEINGAFQLLREDTSSTVLNGYVTLSQQLNIFYNLDSWNKIGIGVNRYNSRLADSTIKGTVQQADINWLSYNAFYTYKAVDNLLYPKKGWWISANIAIGNKEVSPSDQIDLQIIKRSSPQLAYRFTLRKYSRTGKKSSIFFQLSAAQIFNDNLFQNELFRLGGLTSIRGFNENFFFASDYVTSTLEYRFFWEQTSYLFVFYDQAWIRTQILKASVTDIPSGFGAGMSFSTKTGIFTIMYALGNSQTRPFSIGYSKIHFGLTSRF